MKTRNKNLIIGVLIVAVVVLGFVLYNQNQNRDYVVKNPVKNIVISDQKWSKSEDSETYARNFEAREKTTKEAYPQIVTVYLNPMTSDRMLGVKISDNEYLQMFVVHPQTVTVQIRKSKGTYWVLSRQTFSVSEPQLININPESSEQNFSLYQNSFQNEIDTTRHMLDFEF